MRGSFNSETARIAAVVLIVSGILLNKWFLELTIVPDGVIEYPSTLAQIVLVQIVLIGSGTTLYVAVRIRSTQNATLLLGRW